MPDGQAAGTCWHELLQNFALVTDRDADALEARLRGSNSTAFRPTDSLRIHHTIMPIAKCLQVTAQEADDLEARLRGINSMAQIVRAEKANIGVDYVLSVGGFDLDRVEGEVCGSASC